MNSTLALSTRQASRVASGPAAVLAAATNFFDTSELRSHSLN